MISLFVCLASTQMDKDDINLTIAPAGGDPGRVEGVAVCTQLGTWRLT